MDGNNVRFHCVSLSFLSRPISLLLSEFILFIVFYFTLYSLATVLPLRYNTRKKSLSETRSTTLFVSAIHVCQIHAVAQIMFRVPYFETLIRQCWMCGVQIQICRAKKTWRKMFTILYLSIWCPSVSFSMAQNPTWWSEPWWTESML